jgi:hypothetical protein
VMFFGGFSLLPFHCPLMIRMVGKCRSSGNYSQLPALLFGSLISPIFRPG